LELGTVLGEHLGRPEEAARAFQSALALDPANRHAFQGLAKIYRSTGQTDAYLTTLEAELDAARSPTESPRYAEVASAWEELGNLDRAAAAWQKLLAVDSHNQVARQALARTLRAAGRWDELARAHHAHLQAASGASERIPILLELATDLETPDVEGAIAA